MKTTPINRIIISFLGVVLFFTSCENKKSNKMNEIFKPTYAVSYLSAVPLRAEPNHRSEMVSQILFGEYLIVLDTKDEWSYIQLEQDTYKGWVETSQLTTVSEQEYNELTQNPKVKVFDNLTHIVVNNTTLTLVKGSNLPFYSEETFLYKGKRIPYTGLIISGNQSAEKLIEIAYSYNNTPYLWGGKNPLGVDCSGFSQIVYHLSGYTIHRDASLQAKQGELVAFLSEAKPGDLAFFDNEKEKITHVGIILEDGRIIHAAHGKVHVDKLDQEGIYNVEEKKYTHHLRMVRRYF